MDANRSFSANLIDYTELSSVGLSGGQVGRVQDGRGRQLHVETGTVWLTQESCGDDVILEAGESYRIEHDGMTLLVALGVPFALVTLQPAVRVTPTLAERFWSSWAGLYAPQSCSTTASL